MQAFGFPGPAIGDLDGRAINCAPYHILHRAKGGV